MTATDGTTYERYGGFEAHQRSAFNGVKNVPGIIELEDFDSGAEGFTYHDSDTNDEGGVHYRSDNGGVDIVTGNGGYALGYTAAGEWLEYTVNVTQAGEYAFKATVSSGTTGSGFSLGVVRDGLLVNLCNVNVPKTGSDWDTYQVIEGTLSQPLEAGLQRFRIGITGSYCNLDKIELICQRPTNIIQPSTSNLQPSIDNVYYDLQGRRVDRPTKGIYIVGGKKVLIK